MSSTEATATQPEDTSGAFIVRWRAGWSTREFHDTHQELQPALNQLIEIAASGAVQFDLDGRIWLDLPGGLTLLLAPTELVEIANRILVADPPPPRQ